MEAFTLESIQMLKLNEGSCAEIFDLLTELEKLGLTKYEYKTSTGVFTYFHKNGKTLKTRASENILTVNPLGNSEKLNQAIADYQRTTFTEKYREALAQAGVNFYSKAISSRMIYYYDISGELIFAQTLL